MDKTLADIWAHPGSISVMELLLFVVICLLIFLLSYVQVKRDAIDLRWLILNEMRRPSIHKIGQLTALVVSTWGFVALTLKGTLTEFYFTAYMMTWAGSVALDKYLSRDRRAPSRADDPDSAEK